MLRIHLRDKEQGFTLVEILVVIIVIGILAAIAIPLFMNQRKKANDAALTSDLKNVASAVYNADLTGTEFRALFGNRVGVNVWGKDAVYNMTPTAWNSKVPEVPQINVSPGTFMAIWIIPRDEGDWNKHENGEFCLGGLYKNSHYNYVPGSGGGASQYDKYLYYDVQQGGVKKMSELVEAYQKDPRSVSCSGHVRQYMQAHGML